MGGEGRCGGFLMNASAVRLLAGRGENGKVTAMAGSGESESGKRCSVAAGGNLADAAALWSACDLSPPGLARTPRGLRVSITDSDQCYECR